jgi:hypothetical protein
LLEAVNGKRRPKNIPAQPLQTFPIPPGNPHPRMKAESTLPGGKGCVLNRDGSPAPATNNLHPPRLLRQPDPLADRRRLEKILECRILRLHPGRKPFSGVRGMPSASGKELVDTRPNAGENPFKLFLRRRRGAMKSKIPPGSFPKIDTVEKEGMKMNVQVQGPAETLNSRDPTRERVTRPPDARLPTKVAKNFARENPERAGQQFRVPRQDVPHLPRKGKDPLPDGNPGENAVHQVRRGIRHAPAGTGRADAPLLSREPDNRIVAASRTSHPDKPVRQDPATEKAKEGVSNVFRQTVPFRTARFRHGEKGAEMPADQPMKNRLFRLPPPVDRATHFADSNATRLPSILRSNRGRNERARYDS